MADWFDQTLPPDWHQQLADYAAQNYSGRVTTGQNGLPRANFGSDGSLVDPSIMGGNTGLTGGANSTGPIAGGGQAGNPTDKPYVISQVLQTAQQMQQAGQYVNPSVFTDPGYWADRIIEKGGWVNNGPGGDNIGYFSGRFGQPEGAPQQGGGFGSGLDGPVGSTPFNFNFSQDDPSFKFVMQEALDAVNRGNSAKGTGLTGGALKELQNRAANVASTEYGNAFNRAFNTHQANFSNALNANQQAFGQNLNLANLGLQATTNNINAANGLAGQGLNFAQLGQSNAQNQANLLTGQGNVTGAGIIGSNNAWNQFYRNLGNTAQQAFY